MLIFSFADEPLVSASAVNFSAGGPVGMSIMQNHKMGSSESVLVLVARTQIREIEMLLQKWR